MFVPAIEPEKGAALSVSVVKVHSLSSEEPGPFRYNCQYKMVWWHQERHILPKQFLCTRNIPLYALAFVTTL